MNRLEPEILPDLQWMAASVKLAGRRLRWDASPDQFHLAVQPGASPNLSCWPEVSDHQKAEKPQDGLEAQLGRSGSEMKVITHKIGGIVFRTELNAWLPRILEEAFGQFGIENTSPDVHQIISDINPDDSRLPQLSKREKPIFSKHDYFPFNWQSNSLLRSQIVRNRLNGLPDLKEGAVIWVEDHYMFIRDFSCNRIDIFYTKKHQKYPPRHPGTIPAYYVAANLRQIFATFLPHFSATLLHCSGVIRGGKSALFVAPDDGGKTTVLAQSNGEPVLNDDQIIIRKEGDVAVAHGTPLGMITSGPCQAPVGALFMLQKDSTFHIEPASPSEVVQYLWGEHQNYTFYLPRPLKQQTFRLLCDLCYKLPVFLMRFPRNHVDWNAIDDAMGQEVIDNG